MTYFYCWLAWQCPGGCGPSHVPLCFRWPCWSWSRWSTRGGCWGTGNGSPSCWSKSTPWSRGQKLEIEPGLSNSLTVTNLIILHHQNYFAIYSELAISYVSSHLCWPRCWRCWTRTPRSLRTLSPGSCWVKLVCWLVCLTGAWCMMIYSSLWR